MQAAYSRASEGDDLNCIFDENDLRVVACGLRRGHEFYATGTTLNTTMDKLLKHLRCIKCRYAYTEEM